jgi:VWFA-related protein
VHYISPRRLLLPLLLAALSGGVGLARQNAGDQAAQRAVEETPTQVSAILVDVVVRDRSGNPVRGLTADDFELYEDGVRQEIGSMTPIFRAEEPPPATTSEPEKPASAEAAAPETTAQVLQEAPEIIALVFDRLTADSRTLAHSAAVKYLESGPDLANNYMAVYGIDTALLPYQNFTRDKTLILKAIDKFAARSTSQYGSVREALSGGTGNPDQQQQVSNALAGAEAAAAGGDPSAISSVGALAAQQQFSNVQNSVTRTFEALERDQAGYATSNALMAVINGMRAIPGRKSIVFFSEGLAIPANVQEQFRSVIDAANRSNVSIYPMDAMGLRAESDISKVRDEMLATAKTNLNRDPRRDVTGTAMMAAMERNEDLLRMDPHAGLGTLADETGGFFIANTNNLRAGFERIESDMRNYYLLTYVPSNDNFDGKFREIEVKVRKSGVNVHGRKGYYAVREVPGIPVRSYETQALARLEKLPVPNQFPVWAQALSFPEHTRPNLMSIVVQLPTSGIEFKKAEDGVNYTSDFTVLVRFKDAGEQVIDKLSQHYELTGPAEQLEQARNGQVIFYRQPELPPGVYTMETIVYDALSDKASVRFSTVEQSETSADALQLSSLILVSRGERVAEGTASADNPLFVGNTLLYPNLGTPLKKDADKELAFFFTAYPGAGAADALKGTVELLHDAKLLAQAPMELVAPDEAGRVQQVSRLPIESLAPGRYQIRVRVQQGDATVARSTEFRIVS